MNKVPAIIFELLRGGPPHNQLISPITDYLALCGDASPHVLRLPFEHRDLIDRLRRLRYEELSATAEIDRTAELYRLGRDMGALLGSVPAFASELSGTLPDGDGIVHLRLVLAGNELALLPWEVAHIPAGLRSAGIPLLLHPGARISLIREVRGASRRRFRWNRLPRVLFVASDAAEFPPGTVDAHLLALIRALEPWAYRDWVRNGWVVDYPIDVVQCASIKSIRARCLDGEYTHVHVLAHGQPLNPGSNDRFGLRLHDSNVRGQMEIVTGEQLAHALRAGCAGGAASDPLCVTLATCESAQHGSVIVPGGSVAHELHQYGIPWVVASQFPLTVSGSVVFVEDFYGHLLRGEDPRSSLQCLRSHLAARFPDRHDWASLVVYASTSDDFDAQVDAFSERSILERRNRAYSLVDLLVLRQILEQGPGSGPLHRIRELLSQEAPKPEVAREAVDEVSRALAAREPATEKSGAGTDERIYGSVYTHHAALLKRLAEMQWLFPLPGDDWRHTLEEARKYYKEGSTFGRNGTDHWAIGQYLVLDEVLRPRGDQSGKKPDVWWRTACLATEMYDQEKDPDLRMWALATRVDLMMVAMARRWKIGERESLENADSVLDTLTAMVEAGEKSIWPTFRQFWRYLTWWDRPEWSDAASKGYEFLLRKLDETFVERAQRSWNLRREKTGRS